MNSLEIGTCLCGQWNFTAPGSLISEIACHCIQCRKTSGHFTVATSSAGNNVEIKEYVTRHRSSSQARHGLCGICGKQLFLDGSGENIAIFAVSLNRDTGTALAGYMFCADTGDYHQIKDCPPQAAAYDLAPTTHFYKCVVVQ